MMKIRKVKAEFLTPAFLGNAAQDGQWRTPPFKHLLREWWRVAWSEDNGWSNDVNALRRDEEKLFGSASDGTGHRSRLRMRLSRWDRGREELWEEIGTVQHSEVGHPVGASLYLGYGPLTYDRRFRNTMLKSNAAIQAGESAELQLAYPKEEAALIERAVALIDAFGTLGGRSRNGWGSLHLHPAMPGREAGDEGFPLRDWRRSLDRDWPHAIGKDDRGALVWQTEAFDDWRQLMRRLAEIKIGLRTQFAFQNGRNAPHPEERHWLSYPVTNHDVKSWKRNARLPNSLRFKVVRNADGRLRGRIFHVPCLPPSTPFNPDPDAIQRVWSRVHDFLDQANGVERSQS